MAEKASAPAEGSSIFESLFGGFSNGLSVFTNNPFRRKEEIGLSIQEDGRNVTDDEFAVTSAVKENASVDGEGKKGKPSAAAELVENAGSAFELSKEKVTKLGVMQSAKQCEKVERAGPEEKAASEKKRKSESPGDAMEGGNKNNSSAESLKRNVEDEAGVDDAMGEVSKKKREKTSKSDCDLQVRRRSARNSKKRHDEEFLQASELKRRKVEEGIQGDEGLREERLKATGKRDRELEEGEKGKKQKKGSAEEDRVREPMETRSKRKKDVQLEDSRERNRLDQNESSHVQGSEEEPALELDDVRGGQRHLNADAQGEDGSKSAKTKKTAKERKEDDDRRLKRTIFVGNLPLKLKAKQLSREFSKFGAVESARLRSVPLIDSKLPRKAAVITRKLNESRSSLNGYVVFEREESAKAALGHNMTEFNGKHLRVDMAIPPRSADNTTESPLEYDRARSIFVGNLPFDVEDEEVYSLFKGRNADLEVEAVRVVRDPQTSIGKGFAFVCFKKKVGAVAALDNAEYTKLRNRQLRIIRFGAHAKRAAGKLPPKANAGKYRPNPRSEAEQRLSRYRVSSYEGVRSSKIDGRRKKVRGAAQASHLGKADTRRRPALAGKSRKRNAPAKRPAVAARKLASQGKSGILKTGAKNRKKEQKGKTRVNSTGRIKVFTK